MIWTLSRLPHSHPTLLQVYVHVQLNLQTYKAEVKHVAKASLHLV